MKQIVRTAFQSLVAFLPSELAKMPLRSWSESVIRYFYCRILHDISPDVEQFVECEKIDLVLRRRPESAFIEFKFYHHPRRYDPYDGRKLGFKGGPGSKNLSEFQSCVDVLHGRRSIAELSKFIILVYADPKNGDRPNLRYSGLYDDYRHCSDNVPLSLIEQSEPIETPDSIVRAKLYEVGR